MSNSGSTKYQKKTGKIPGKNRHTAHSLKQDEPAANGAIPLQTYAKKLSLMTDNEHSTQEVTTMADWEIYADELQDDNELLCLPQSPLYREIQRENQRAQKRQEHGIGVVHHQVDALIMEHGSDR